MQTLSINDARKLALLSQYLSKPSDKSSPKQSALNVIEQLGYVQVDTISVVQRAHHHVLWSRDNRYQPDLLDELVSDKNVFEYWAHAAAYLPMCDYRYTLLRKETFKLGQQGHWYPKDQPLMDSILQRIRDEGPLMAKDFVSDSHKTQGWGSKPTKQALENLYMQGDLMTRERRNFHKVYDLTERVLPDGIDLTTPTLIEHARFLVLNYLRAHSFGNESEICYQIRGVKPIVRQAIQVLQEEKSIELVKVNGAEYFVLTASLELLNKRLNRKSAKILSPFDNLLIQRKRASHIFDFDYLLECYVPQNKRQFGYFTLPILWNGQLVARADCKMDKKAGNLNVLNLIVEPTVSSNDELLEALDNELISFAKFNNGETYSILKSSTRSR